MFNFLLFISFFLSHSTFAQNNNANGNIAVGSSLTASENSTSCWPSPSGDFALGFKQLQDSNNLFLLSIWFDKIPNKTVVWYVTGGNPVQRGSTLHVDSMHGLVLRDPKGNSLWNATDGNAREVAYGLMNDTGNFVLVDTDSTFLWESFRHPADTILPTQTLEIGDMLVSRKTETNFSVGRFYARMVEEGNLVFNTRVVPSNTDFDDEYYNSGTSDARNALNSGKQVLLNVNGSLSIRLRNGEEKVLSPPAILPASFYYRATLNFDGVFTQYYHSKNSISIGNNRGWTPVRSLPENICASIDGLKGSGACGYNNVCRLENQRPVCECPQQYSLVDPSNAYGDCNQDFVPTCAAGGNGSAQVSYNLSEIYGVDWPQNDYEQINSISESNCRNACLSDCLCAAATFKANTCWKKKLPLSNGIFDANSGSISYLKIGRGNNSLNLSTPAPTPTIDKPKIDERKLILVGSVLLGSSMFILVAACLSFCFICYKKKAMFSKRVPSTIESNLHCFTYKELFEATEGFKEELGRGAFGIVYKGVIPNDSKAIIAVKKLDKVAQDSEKEFRAEVNAIGHTHHKNLVRLVGFCDEGHERLLVYEYMSSGTLAAFIFADLKPSWSLRTQIALGVARGLTYLHEECGTQIIHCDIKPQNILLDEYYNARISDFGLAKLLVMNQSRTQTNIRGTKGYVAPEWFRNTQITAKVDVYSFGVLLLEIITCRKSVQDLEFGENPILTDWVWDSFLEGRLDVLVGNDEEALSDAKRLEMFVMTGIWCIQEDLSLRPTMRRVSQMLEGIVEVAVPPCPFFFSSTV